MPAHPRTHLYKKAPREMFIYKKKISELEDCISLKVGPSITDVTESYA